MSKEVLTLTRISHDPPNNYRGKRPVALDISSAYLTTPVWARTDAGVRRFRNSKLLFEHATS
jgi:hypothetical protein